MSIYYESRIAKLALNAAELPKLDKEFEAIIPQSRDEEPTSKEKRKTKWGALDAKDGKARIASVELNSVWLASSASLRLSA